MMRAISRGAKRAHGLFALAVAAALVADPVLAEAQQNRSSCRDASSSSVPTATPAPAESQAPAPAATQAPVEAEQSPENSLFTREELAKSARAYCPLSRSLARADAAGERLSRADRPGAALAGQEQDVRRQERLFRDRQSELGSRGEGSRALSGCYKLMSADLDWTTDLGDAEVNQPQDVAEVIQDLRAKAEAAGTLKTTDQQTIERVEASAPPGAGASQGSAAPQPAASYISIQPTDPSKSMSRLMTRSAVYQPYTGIAFLLGLRRRHRGWGALEQ